MLQIRCGALRFLKVPSTLSSVMELILPYGFQEVAVEEERTLA